MEILNIGGIAKKYTTFPKDYLKTSFLINLPGSFSKI